MKDIRRFKNPKDVDTLIDVLINTTLSKDLSPMVVNSLSRLLSLKLKIYELKDLESRIERLEKLVEEISRR
ncbi:MAG TPA: hypothetical protein ENF50_04570 [Archaeoglobus veneficus]|nr:hypothetical protein [Archaeoglobus veneficus]